VTSKSWAPLQHREQHQLRKQGCRQSAARGEGRRAAARARLLVVVDVAAAPRALLHLDARRAQLALLLQRGQPTRLLQLPLARLALGLLAAARGGVG